jgi:excinuclease ABC subunit A
MGYTRRVIPVSFMKQSSTPSQSALEAASDDIRIRGASQHNLKNIDLDLHRGEITVVTGVSGSGKSSLVFDTLYAEGQRRYVETFSPYARQFLDRMDKPRVQAIENVPPAIAIDQTNQVRTSRSTVGTMTEINDHLKLLFARASTLHCRQCGNVVKEDTVATITRRILQQANEAGDPRLVLTFPLQVPSSFTEEEVQSYLSAQGYTRIHSQTKDKKTKTVTLDVVQDRFRASSVDAARLSEAIEAALLRGRQRMDVQVLGSDNETVQCWRFSSGLHCAACDLSYTAPLPSSFSFNSPIGACEACRGFGRVIGIDYGLVVPDEGKTLSGGAVKPWQTPSFSSCQADLLKFAKRRGHATDIAWRDLPEDARQWVIQGDADFDGNWEGSKFYGVKRFFDWLESRTYKMHVRVLLSKYRSYTSCTTCQGARLKTDGLLWRLGAGHEAPLGDYKRLRPAGVQWSDAQTQTLPGVSIHELMLMPVDRVEAFMQHLMLPAALGQASELVLAEIRARLRFLRQVGLGYLTLDRQSRTLSGGEVQRINLTTALGTSLVNTLFVLDEPSVGLHPRDMERVIAAMRGLKEAGNTLVVVEHDPQVMLAADRILDMGPGPGEHGGQIVFDGNPCSVLSAQTPTGDYLAGRRRIALDRPLLAVDAETPAIALHGVTANNLKHLDIRFPLKRMVVVTGVSGSGKSTLVQDVLVPAIKKTLGEPTEAPGAFKALSGVELIAGLAFVDQSAIGKTTRSNPASYVGAFDALRTLFCKTPLARERAYTAGFFSFNSGDGRCPACGGNGFEHVEMQFLSDVYLRCGDCNATRYRPEALDVKIERGGRELHMADVLELTVSEALELFAGDRDVLASLQPLSDVGLDYLRLGQPVPTLSGGEAQRLKLAGFLVEAAAALKRPKLAKKGMLFVFDEPTTGLHFQDVAKLMRALDMLLQAGHSLLIVEHNLDVIACADWLIDLGPEAGEGGGALVCEGPPQAVMDHAPSHTGRALKAYQAVMQDHSISAKAKTKAQAKAAVAPVPERAADEQGMPLQVALRQRRGMISILNAREHNLRNVSLDIAHKKMTVITGPSGSGKSTLAFDILFAEGQRRYLESLNAYARQFVQPAAKPDVDAIYGIAPTVAIEQRTSRGGRKSTVATVTEVYHFMRLLYVKLGVQHCPHCDVPIAPQSFDAILAQCLKDYKRKTIDILAPLVVARKGVYNEIAKWAKGKGYSHLRVDGVRLPVDPWPKLDRYKEHSIELPMVQLTVSAKDEAGLRDALKEALALGKGMLMVECEGEVKIFSTKRACPLCAASFQELDPRLFSYNSKHGWCSKCMGTGIRDLEGLDAEKTGEEAEFLDAGPARDEDGALLDPLLCGLCDGQRLNETALAVKFQAQSIAQLARMTVDEAQQWVAQLKLTSRDAQIAQDIVAEMGHRLSFLKRVGLSYLNLDRSAPTLSGGEAQRIRLAAQLGTNLTGVCYVLDEPTIGLHTRDNERLLEALKELQGKGNTLVVVEHDEDTMRQADCLIDMGPGAGVRGGQVISQGSVQAVCDDPASLTGRYLSQPIPAPSQARRAIDADTPRLRILNARLHNLDNVSVDIPLGRWVSVTGVSGSGKSTLAREVLLTNMAHCVNGRIPAKGWLGCDSIAGADQIMRVLEVDQTPIGKTPRSCPATYIGFWDTIRKLLADTVEAGMRGFAANRFSFNAGPGRCPVCEGQGMQTVEMNFLPDVKVLCDACRGDRFNPDTLQVRWRGKNAAELLRMNVDDAVVFFQAHRSIHEPLKLLQDVGLGYLTLGQASPTLSGGEAQRIKLVTELAKVRVPATGAAVGADGASDAAPPRLRMPRIQPTLYVLDEPTVGLHMNDVEKLIAVLHRLVDAGHTVVTIEHDLDLIAQSDWVIDMGPEGGAGGGRVMVQGMPAQLAKKPKASHTARALAGLYERRSQASGRVL